MALTHARYTALGLIAVLTACSGSEFTTPSAPSQAPMQQTINGEHVLRFGSQVIRYGGSIHHSIARRGWISQALPASIIYGASYDGGYVNIYALKGNNQAPVGQLTSGLVSPQGIVVDSFHHVWVANTNASNIVAFKRGATTPFRTLNDPGYFPTSVAVDGNGTVFAANVVSTTGGPGNVTFWKKGRVNPSGTLTFSGFTNTVNCIGVDSSNNIYVSYVPKSAPPAVAVFPAGSKTGQQLNIQDATVSDITFDSSKNLVMLTLSSNNLGVWAPPYTSGPTRTIPNTLGNEPTLDKNEGKIYIAYANFSTPKIEGFNYLTGKLVDTITNGWTSTAIPYGVAIDPPAPR